MSFTHEKHELVIRRPKADFSVAPAVIKHALHGTFTLYLLDDDDPVATSTSPKRLSAYAFANGAQECRHQYDLRLAEEGAVKVKL